MAKFIINSSQLAKKLATIDFDVDAILNVSLDHKRHRLTITTQNDVELVFDVEANQSFNGYPGRWKWLAKDVAGIQEQPIVLVLTGGHTQLIIDY